jgi:tryptophanyl-tRNA synthetase
MVSQAAPRIMSLRDATAKMSKSNPSEMARVNLIDSNDEIAQKFRKAKTDPEPLPDSFDALANRPEARNLVTIFAALADRTPQSVVEEFAGQGFGQFKPALADLAVATLGPIRDELTRLLDDRAAVSGVLANGAEKAAELAAPTLRAAQETMGLEL